MLWLNSATSTVMYQYMMYEEFSLLLCLLPWLFSAAGYYYGYRYTHKNISVNKKTYLVVFAVYTGLFAIGPLTRIFWLNFHAILFSYECGRLLAFRAVWLEKRVEGYLHLLIYLLIVFSCLAHNRADFTLLVFIPFHIVALFLALYSLDADHQSENSSRSPVVSLAQTLTAIMLLTVMLSVIIPNIKLWDFQIIPQKIDLFDSNNGNNPASNLIAYLSTQKLTANPGSGIDEWVIGTLQSIEAYTKNIRIPLIDYWFLLLIMLTALIVFSIWKFRRNIYIYAFVALIDPLRVAFISENKKFTVQDTYFLYRAYERLWEYKGIRRSQSMSPFEHLLMIAKNHRILAKPSLIIVQCFQSVRYGNNKPVNINNAITQYLIIRKTVAPDISAFFGKKYTQ